MNKKVIKEKLSMINQSHLLRFENELSKSEKDNLYKQINELDYSVLYENSVEQKKRNVYSY